MAFYALSIFLHLKEGLSMEKDGFSEKQALFRQCEYKFRSFVRLLMRSLQRISYYKSLEWLRPGRPKPPFCKEEKFLSTTHLP